ncbi:MAG: sigma-54-dependent Fis family transcriptional regulator [Devosia sp.]
MTDPTPKKAARPVTTVRKLQSPTPMARDVDCHDRQTMRAWENFLTGRSIGSGPDGVRTLIAESWERSAGKGVNSLSNDAPMTHEEDEVQRRRGANMDLVEAAQIPFLQLGRLLEDARAMLVLTDRDGIILDTIGDAQTLDDARQINLEVGGVWNEGAAGTNGIGTALFTGEPVFVHASEHFCAGIKNWTCAGAPVRDPMDGSVMGVVDLSGPPGIFRPHNTALVTAAAREIESALVGRFTAERARLLELCLRLGYGAHPDSGLVILDPRGRVVFARNAPERLPVNGSERDISLGRYLLPTGETISTSDVSAALPDEPRLKSVERVWVDGRVRGFALEFAPQMKSTLAAAQPVRAPVIVAPPSPVEPTIIGKSQALIDALTLTRRVASAAIPLLFEGETGVGKELLARLVHSISSTDANAPFVVMNCGAASTDVFGEELFGRAARHGDSGVSQATPGRVEMASGGVLCLDEIGEMPLDLQPFLLRVLEDNLTCRIGDPRVRPVNIRVIGLTNRSLHDEVEVGSFRRDLYFRIGAATIKIPPLRERGEDVGLLVNHFNEEVAERIGVDPLHFSGHALEALHAYSWPGNVRELRNTIELIHLANDTRTVDLSDLPQRIVADGERLDAGHSDGGMIAGNQLKSAERQVILDALHKGDGNVSRAAAMLGISRATLYRKMRAFGIRRTTAMAATELN